MSTEWTAGGIISSMQDLALYGVTLRDGTLLKTFHFQADAVISVEFVQGLVPLSGLAIFGPLCCDFLCCHKILSVLL